MSSACRSTCRSIARLGSALSSPRNCSCSVRFRAEKSNSRATGAHIAMLLVSKSSVQRPMARALRCHALVSARIRRKSWFAQATDLLERRTDSAVAADALEEAPTSSERDYLVECGVHRLRDRLRAEDLAYFIDLVPVDDQRGLVGFGYLPSHYADILLLPPEGGESAVSRCGSRSNPERSRCLAGDLEAPT